MGEEECAAQEEMKGVSSVVRLSRPSASVCLLLRDRNPTGITAVRLVVVLFSSAATPLAII